ncbi:MAG: ACP phosphodiesterase [Akkermansiaceae bacterium]
MNFLAHFLLAEPTDASRVGALLSDFVRGTPESLSGKFPDEVIEGIILHRRIDSLTDGHPVFLKCKQWLRKDRRKFSGIIVDLFFDHFLTKYWDRFGDGDLSDYIDHLYTLLERRSAWLTDELRQVTPRMKREDWLRSYSDIEGLRLTFRRVSQRRDFLTPIVGSEEDLDDHYDDFEKAFLCFYPDLQSALR